MVSEKMKVCSRLEHVPCFMFSHFYRKMLGFEISLKKELPLEEGSVYSRVKSQVGNNYHDLTDIASKRNILKSKVSLGES